MVKCADFYIKCGRIESSDIRETSKIENIRIVNRQQQKVVEMVQSAMSLLLIAMALLSISIL